MSLCINPDCPRPDHAGNSEANRCQACGTTLILQGRYRVMRVLSSQTGFGVVYEAYERNLPKILKVLRRDRARLEKVLSLFKQEATVLSQLRHPGVPYVSEEGYFTLTPPDTTEPLHCIVMEKIDGLNLKQWMRQQGNHPIHEEQAIGWLQQLAGILQQIHQSNYFHRDIKPDNVMIRTSGQLTLVDFGAAREMTHTYLGQMHQGSGVTAISSAGYTPPEQEQGQAVPQSDFYALGRTLIYLLTANSPSDTALYDPLENRFEWRSQAPQVSLGLADLIDSMIAPRVVDRPKTAQAILDRIQALLAQPSDQPVGNVITDLPETTLPPIAPTEMPGTTALQPGIMAPWESLTTSTSSVTAAESSLFKAKRPRWQWGAAALASLIALGGGAIALRTIVPAVLTPAQTPAALSEPPELRVQLQRTLPDHRSSINDLVLFADGRRLLSASADKTIRLWDLTTGEMLRSWDEQSSFVNTVLLSPDETQLYSGNADGNLYGWEIAETEPLWQQLAHSGAVNTIGQTPDGQRLASGGADGNIHIWNASTGQGLRSLTAHQGAVNALVVTSDGQYIVSGGTDRNIKVWNIDSGELVRTLQGHESFVNALVLSPDGRFLFSASADGTVRHWQVDTGKLLHTLEGHSSYVNDVVVSRDGQTLSSSGADKTIRAWDVQSGVAKQVLTGFGMPVDHLVLSSAGQIVTASRTTPAIKIWLEDQ